MSRRALRPLFPAKIARLDSALRTIKQRPVTKTPAKRQRTSDPVWSKALENAFGAPNVRTIESAVSVSNIASLSWQRGDIIRLPWQHAEVPDSEFSILDDARERHAIVVAVFDYSIQVLPIVVGSGSKLRYRPTSMHVLPAADPDAHVLASDNKLFVDQSWRPSSYSFVNLQFLVSITQTDSIARVSQLDARSTAILMQRFRITHNMSFLPPKLQVPYFRAMVTREPILPPLPPNPEADGSTVNARPAEEFYLSSTAGFVVSNDHQRSSFASDNENLLDNDLGFGIVRGKHDMEAAKVLLDWKPSLKYLLQGDTSRSSSWSCTPPSSPDMKKEGTKKKSKGSPGGPAATKIIGKPPRKRSQPQSTGMPNAESDPATKPKSKQASVKKSPTRKVKKESSGTTKGNKPESPPTRTQYSRKAKDASKGVKHEK